MVRGRIAIPSIGCGGLRGQKSPHFAYCNCFTIVDVEHGQVQKVSIIQKHQHMHNGCRRYIETLVNNKVDALITGGMGVEALKGMKQAGIEVYYDSDTVDITSVVCDLIFDRLPLYTNHHIWEWPFSRQIKGEEIASSNISNREENGDFLRSTSFSAG